MSTEQLLRDKRLLRYGHNHLLDQTSKLSDILKHEKRFKVNIDQQLDLQIFGMNENWSNRKKIDEKILRWVKRCEVVLWLSLAELGIIALFHYNYEGHT